MALRIQTKKNLYEMTSEDKCALILLGYMTHVPRHELFRSYLEDHNLSRDILGQDLRIGLARDIINMI